MSEIEDIINLLETEDRDPDENGDESSTVRPSTPKRVTKFKGTVPKRGTKEYVSYRRKCLNGTIKKRGRPFAPDSIEKERKEKLRKYRMEYYRKYRAEKRAVLNALLEDKRKLDLELGIVPEKIKRTRKKRKQRFLSYDEASEIVKFEGIASSIQYERWYKYNKPGSLPANPYNVYSLEGTWKGWGDFLGVTNSYPAIEKVKWRSYKEAHAYAQTLHNINTSKEWMEYGRDGKLPNDIPIRPDVIYRKAGNEWISWSVFLRKRGQSSALQYVMTNNDGILYILRLDDPINPNLYKIGVTVGGVSSIRDAINRYQMEYIMAYNVGKNTDDWKNVINSIATEHWDMPGIYEISNINSILPTLDRLWMRMSLS